MKNSYVVKYTLSGITSREDLFSLENGDVDSAVKAIQEKLNGVWSFNADEIEVTEIIAGHYEQRAVKGLPFARKVWVPDDVKHNIDK